MADLNSVPNPINPVPQPDSTSPSSPSPQAFKKAIENVSEADAKQKKKGRHPQEDLEKALAPSKTLEKPEALVSKIQSKKGSAAASKKPLSAAEKGIQGEEQILWEEDSQSAQEAATLKATEKQNAQLASSDALASQKGQPAPATPKKEQPSLSVEKEEKKEEKARASEKKESAPPLQQAPLPAQPASVASSAPLTPTAPPTYANLHPQVMELFEKMVGVLTIMQTTGEKTTSLQLNSPQYASSLFYGTQIIIREYAPAPGSYNIELLGNPQAVALFTENLPNLQKSFQEGNYPFHVNRIEASLYRVEKTEGEREQKDQNSGDSQ